MIVFVDRSARPLRLAFAAFAESAREVGADDGSLLALERQSVSLEIHRDTPVPTDADDLSKLKQHLTEQGAVDEPKSVLVIDDVTQGYYTTIDNVRQVLGRLLPGANVSAVAVLDSFPPWSFEGFRYPGLATPSDSPLAFDQSPIRATPELELSGTEFERMLRFKSASATSVGR